MTSANQVTANRKNAHHSTGPRTRAGKARSSANALRHGLATPVGADPVLDAKVRTLARAIAGDDASPERMEFAECIAEAQVDLGRIRDARLALIRDALDNSNYKPLRLSVEWVRVMASIIKDPNNKKEADDDGTIDLDDKAVEVINRFREEPLAPERLITRFAEVAGGLSRLDRYERRALSRRKTAIRAFEQREE